MEIRFNRPLPDAGPRKVYGICLHTTGDGIPAEVHRTGDNPLDVAHRTYAKMETVGPHYAIDPLGNVEQYADPAAVRHHVGLEAEHRRSFLDGHWKADANRISRECVKWWEARWAWSGKPSPSHLYPSQRPNLDYIGIELIPAGTYLKDRGWVWQTGAAPGYDKQRFSVEEYVSAARLIRDLSTLYGIDLAAPGRLVGHEDLNPYTRPGWDPGDGRGFFSWSVLTGLLRANV